MNICQLVLFLYFFVLIYAQPTESVVRQHYLRHLKDKIHEQDDTSFPINTSNYTYISLVSQCSVDKLVYLPFLLKRWKGPIILSVFYTDGDHSIVQNIIQSSSYSKQVTFIPYHADTNNIYPINKLRNLAVDAVQTPYYLLIDIDMLPSSLLEEYITYMLSKVKVSDHLALIIPSFIYQFTKYIDNLSLVLKQVYSSIPTTKDILLQCIDSNQCNIYRTDDSTHLYLYEEWFYDYSISNYFSMVNCFENHIQEPYLLLKKSSILPRFDERFINYGYNYISYIEQLRYNGFEFGIINNGFLIALPSIVSPHKREWLRARHQVTSNDMETVFTQFMTELKSQKDQSIIYICDQEE